MNRWVTVEPAGGGKDGAVADNAKGVSVSFSLSPSKKRRVVAGTGTAHSAVPKRTTTGSVFQQQQHISDRGRIQGAAASAGAGAGAAAAPQPQHPQQRLPPNSSQSRYVDTEWKQQSRTHHSFHLMFFEGFLKEEDADHNILLISFSVALCSWCIPLHFFSRLSLCLRIILSTPATTVLRAGKEVQRLS